MTFESEKRCNTTHLMPKYLGVRGEALWSELITGATTAARRVLIGEACRLTDRLDMLDRDGEIIEARLTAATLSQILARLDGQQGESTGGSIADEVAARRAARQSGTAG